MMSDLNITATIAQLPNVQGVAGAQLAHPEAQQVFAAQMAQQALKDQHQQVQKVEKQEESNAIKDEDEERRNARREAGSQKRKTEQEARDEEETGPSGSSPWLGHLVNKKV